MNHEIENLKSSQISPNFEVHKNSKVLSGLYTQMLLDDFCRSYSIEFSVDKNRQCFYDISPVGDTLKSILSSQQPWKFENIMDDLLSHMTANLIQYGRFFTEIVLLTDCGKHGIIKANKHHFYTEKRGRDRVQQETHESNGAQPPWLRLRNAWRRHLAPTGVWSAPWKQRAFPSPTPSTPPTTAGQTGNGRPFSASADVFPSTPFPCGSFWHD